MEKDITDITKDFMNKTIDSYFTLENAIHRYFDYKEVYRTIPVLDQRDCEWCYKNETLYLAYINLEKALENDICCCYYLYKQRFLQKHVYETSDFTMICCDTKVDGNKYLVILDNNKRKEL